ncbi:MAG: hypothetical protein ABIQ02_10690, partial [Saprospiraceae bacterium]
MSARKTKAIATKKRRALKIGLIILVLIIAIRLVLPYMILHYVNKSLASIHDYFGHVYDVDLSLYRGAYIVKDISINKVDSITRKQTPVFSCPHVDLSMEWRSL